jgi:hypothetical protein
MGIEIREVHSLHYELENNKLDKIAKEIENIKEQLNTLLTVIVHVKNAIDAPKMHQEMERILSERFTNPSNLKIPGENK